MKIRHIAAALTILSCAFGATAAGATPYNVFAQANSSSGGVGLPTLVLTAGQSFSVSSSTDDLWSLGNLPRYSDGDGLVGNRFATASDDSGQPPGTQIGANFGLWNQNSLSAPYGSLVGEIGGVYQLLGANFSGAAWNSGLLNLYTWDSNSGDNLGFITFDVSAAATGVPEPVTLSLFGAGLVGAAAMRRRRKQAA